MSEQHPWCLLPPQHILWPRQTRYTSPTLSSSSSRSPRLTAGVRKELEATRDRKLGAYSIHVHRLHRPPDLQLYSVDIINRCSNLQSRNYLSC